MHAFFRRSRVLSFLGRRLGRARLISLVYRRHGWAAAQEYRRVLRGGDAPYAAMLRIDPGLAFDAAYYRATNRVVRRWHIRPWHHYVLIGSAIRRQPHPLFDPEYYIEQNEDVRDSGIDPFFHYLLHGMRERRAPSASFDPAWYLLRYKDVAAARIDPFLHYVAHGLDEGRLPLEQGGAIPAYEAWQLMNRLSARDRTELCAILDDRKADLPKISLVTPVYNTDQPLFEDLIEAVLNQIHGDWELCLVDDASPSEHVAPMLARAAERDGRIRVTRLAENGGISMATNAGVAMATGDIVAFLDHDDLVTPDCVAELALYYADHPDADVVYSDDDKVDMAGVRYAPQFKPDWSPVLLLSYMYISHVFSVRRTLFQELGGFRKRFDGSQDYDFALRAAEVARHVGHIPKILYHWRAAPGSTAQSADAKPASLEAGRLAVEEAVARRGYAAKAVIQPDWAIAARCGIFEIEFVDEGPSVTLVIPTKNQVGYLERCIESLELTTYRNYDVLIVDNESDDPATLSYLEAIALRPRTRVVRIGNPGGRFSYSALNNAAVRGCTADYVLFLNNDTQVIAPGWLSQMMGYARMAGVGAVGARLYFDDDTIQHAGIVHGYNEGLVGHAFRNQSRDDWGYMGFIRTAREYSGVTAACMLTPRRLFEKLGGFDETNFAVAYSDVDYCYRVIGANQTCVYCPTAELYHFEGKSRGFNDNPRERTNLRRLYGDWRDEWYNPNLSLENERFEPAAIRAETRSTAPLRLVVVSHNLNHEGAPSTLMDLTIGLVRRGVVVAHVVSPEDGPLRALYEGAGIPVTILDFVPMHGIPTDRTYDRRWIDDGNLAFGRQLQTMGAEIVMANTLITYWAITGAAVVGIPAIWCQHESEPWEYYYDYLPREIRPTAYGAFALAYRVLYVAEATRRAWRPLDSRRNFQVIRHGIPLARLAEETGRWERERARTRLGIEREEIVIEIVGTVCRRKGQIDLVQAFAVLPPAVQQRLRLFIAGHIAEEDYGRDIAAVVAALPVEVAGRVVVTGPIEDPFLYYAAADIAVCTSRIESAPRVIVEAMACGLPIVTTPVFGIPELVIEDVNALFYDPEDIDALAAKLGLLVDDERLRARLASNSRAVLDGQPGFDEMVAAYGSVLRSAVNLRMDVGVVDDGREIDEVGIGSSATQATGGRRPYFPLPKDQADLHARLPDLSDVSVHRSVGGIAVVVHVYYPDLWEELRRQLATIPVPFDLYVSLVSGRSDHLEARLSMEYPASRIKIFPNHGRDVFPFTEFLNAGAFDGYELLCKLHTKKSLHRDDGTHWRKTLYTQLLGSQANVEHIIQCFQDDETIGIFVPDGHCESYMGANGRLVRNLLDRIDVPLDTSKMAFPSGNMFWMRASCLTPIRDLGIGYDEYPLEAGQLDGTIGHALERVIGIVCAHQGKRIVTTSDIGDYPPRASASSVHQRQPPSA